MATTARPYSPFKQCIFKYVYKCVGLVVVGMGMGVWVPTKSFIFSGAIFTRSRWAWVLGINYRCTLLITELSPALKPFFKAVLKYVDPQIFTPFLFNFLLIQKKETS